MTFTTIVTNRIIGAKESAFRRTPVTLQADGTLRAKLSSPTINCALLDATTIAGTLAAGKADTTISTLDRTTWRAASAGKTILTSGTSPATLAIIQIAVSSITASTVSQTGCPVATTYTRASTIMPSSATLPVVSPIGDGNDQAIKGIVIGSAFFE